MSPAHTAKTKFLSAKGLPRVALGKELTTYVVMESSSLPRASCRTLVKGVLLVHLALDKLLPI
jgi:hypothetical protein